MINQYIDSEFTLQGPVLDDKSIYLPRSADEELLAACQAGKFAYVFAPPQTGKSSLMFRTAAKLRQQAIKAAIVDLSDIGGNVVDADQWYFNFIALLAEKLQLDIDIDIWWEKRGYSGLSLCLQRFLSGVVLKIIQEPIVIFIDEIEKTLEFAFREAFFASLHAIYSSRRVNRVYQRLTFVLLGVAIPDQLMTDIRHTPFRLKNAQHIHLPDFSKEECQRFRQKLESKHADQGHPCFEQIYIWTSGHPHLTQNLCHTVLNEAEAKPEIVDDLVKRRFHAPGASGDLNIFTIQNKIKNDEDNWQMVEIYRRLRESQQPVLDDPTSLVISKLKVYGLVVAQNGRLKLRNKLYAKILDDGQLLSSRERYGLALVAIMGQRKAGASPEDEMPIIGTGFLVTVDDKNYLITCAHAIRRQKKGKGEIVTFLHYSASSIPLIACVEHLPPLESALGDIWVAEEDIVILEVTSSLPSGVKPFLLRDFHDSQMETECWCFGYSPSRKHIVEQIDNIACIRPTSGKFIELSLVESRTSRFQEGISGAPLSNRRGKIIGMLHARIESEGYLIPARFIREALLNLTKP